MFDDAVLDFVGVVIIERDIVLCEDSLGKPRLKSICEGHINSQILNLPYNHGGVSAF